MTSGIMKGRELNSTKAEQELLRNGPRIHTPPENPSHEETVISLSVSKFDSNILTPEWSLSSPRLTRNEPLAQLEKVQRSCFLPLP